MTETRRYPCVIMRGGTSKALFFRTEDLPADPHERDDVIFAAFGSGDPRQIDGLGGADVLTSKLAIIGPPSRADVDIDYTFGQVGIEDRVIDYSLNCGNISSAVGVYAIQEGLVEATEPITTVRVLNTNTDKVLRLYVPVANGRPRVRGDFTIAGVPGSGAEIRLDLSDTVGAMTGRLLPTGSPVDEVWVEALGRSIELSIVDVANAAVFFRASDIGLTGSEGPDKFTPGILDRYTAIQQVAAKMANMPESDSFPRPVAVAEPQSFRNYMTGELVDASEADLLGRRVILPPPKLHKAFAATGAVCTGVAARLPGTVVHAVCRPETNGVIRIGHPTGVFPVRIDVADGVIREASFSRTARRIMDGTVFVR
jgi:2-methylaconitate cis-trans-isomerase PrpF